FRLRLVGDVLDLSLRVGRRRAGGIVALSFYATDAGDLPQLQFPGVSRGDEAEDVDRVFDVHDLGDRGTDGQGLADDHLEPADSASLTLNSVVSFFACRTFLAAAAFSRWLRTTVASSCTRTSPFLTGCPSTTGLPAAPWSTDMTRPSTGAVTRAAWSGSGCVV